MNERSRPFTSALIMAAGKGTRMMPLTADLPKPMAEFNGTTLLGNVIEMLRPHTRRTFVAVGYLGDVLAQHAISMGVAAVFDTSDRPSGWWIANTLLSQLDEPVLVTTSDNLFEIDLDALRNDYDAAGSPACMIVPVHAEVAAGDRLICEGRLVRAIGPDVRGNHIASGMQILRPAHVGKLSNNLVEFHGIWNLLINYDELHISSVVPQNWAAVDTEDQLLVSQIAWPGSSATAGRL